MKSFIDIFENKLISDMEEMKSLVY